MSRIDFLDADSMAAVGRAVASELAQADRERVSGRRVGDRTRSVFSPRLAYGRHRGPARLRSRHAAVAIVIYPQRSTGQWCLTLTRRPAALKHHGGQVCLPGGRIESGESPIQAALREYHEELGVRVGVTGVLGRLQPIYVFASDNLVETMIVIAGTPPQRWNTDPVEVDEVIEMPLAALVDLGQMLVADSFASSEQGAKPRVLARQKKRRGKALRTGEEFEFEFGHLAIEFRDCEGRVCELWGATAMLLEEFAGVLARAMVG